VRYAIARHARENREYAYRMYVTENLRIVGENTAKSGGGSYITQRYVDMIEPRPEDNRSAEEIAADVIARSGLILRRGGGEAEPV
jgi:hypothetical protein